MELKLILEALLFSAQKPLTPQELSDLLRETAENSEEPVARSFRKTSPDHIHAALEELRQEHLAAGRTYHLVCVAGAWQFVCKPDFAPWLKTLVGHKPRPPRLSQPALETLTIIAYRQPVTRAEMEQVRGVSVDGVLQTLVERGLVAQVGRAEVVGRPMTYGTTPLFLEYFGLRALEDLPAADELRRIPVERPDSLLTLDPGLATVPPEQLALPQAGFAPEAPGPATAPSEPAQHAGSTPPDSASPASNP